MLTKSAKFSRYNSVNNSENKTVIYTIVIFNLDETSVSKIKNYLEQLLKIFVNNISDSMALLKCFPWEPLKNSNLLESIDTSLSSVFQKSLCNWSNSSNWTERNIVVWYEMMSELTYLGKKKIQFFFEFHY